MKLRARRIFFKSSRWVFFGLLLGTLGLNQSGCSSNGEVEPEIQESFRQFLTDTFYFASTRSLPNNEEMDGDIFFTSAAGPAGSNTLTNLTGGAGSEPGDDDDHICLLDLERGRTFFMSRRTDIGNTAGDMDIFMVPSLGGPMINLTDDLVGDSSFENGDDFCNAIHRPTGDLIFTSDRDYDGHNDPDIYRKQILVDDMGNAFAGPLLNLTNKSDDGTTSDQYDYERFLALVGDSLFFFSRRPNPDSNGIENCGTEGHIFMSDLTQSPGEFTNLSQEGDDAGCLPLAGTPSGDRFCGIVPQINPITGIPFADRVVFESSQDVGDDIGGTQFSFDTDLFVVSSAEPNTIHNLTDAFSDDAGDSCQRIASRVLTPIGEIPLTEKFVAIFSSNRRASGLRNSSGLWSDTVNADGDTDLFMTDLALGTPGNRLDPLSDLDPSDPLSSGPGNDSSDFLVGLCGTTAIFDSTREDLQANPFGDPDLFAVDFGEFGVSEILPLTNNPDAVTPGEDEIDCFLGCDMSIGSALFASIRTDNGNDHGPVNDSDIFRARFRDDSGSLHSAAGVTIENLTDAPSGDGFDYGLEPLFSSDSCNPNSLEILESEVQDFSSDIFSLDFEFSEFRQDDFAFGLNILNTLLFTSERQDPVNVDVDTDIFSLELPIGLDSPVTASIVNRTDHPVLSDPEGENNPTGSEDGHDGLEAYIDPLGGPFQ